MFLPGLPSIAIGVNLMRRVIASLFLLAFSTLPVSAADPYGDLIRQDEPVAWWRFDGDSAAQLS
ncbi:MAG: hypothetical protein KDA66_08850, partial [Planctomycetaceae bacterium]|nr:hypothetical protein [Planctomycetaceae bacterium]